MVSAKSEAPKVVLVGVQTADVSDVEHEANLLELGRLVKTLGYQVVAQVSQKRETLSRGLVLGEGKLAELAKLTGGSGVVGSSAPKRTSKAREKWEREAEEEASDPELEPDEDKSAKATMVVVDHELSPNQIKSLERATGVTVLDRSGVIVDIFHRHARSREARLQVEIARLAYLAPRLRESGGASERQAGRGAGDTAIELDRRRIRDRLAELRRELESIQNDQASRRYARKDQLRVALVGYTNAGKSSLMRALTGSEVLVADQLFATLDTTVRALHPETKPRILVSDTVGFIQKLPHDLVASFRSTLDEAMEASLLLYTVDASDPTFENQLQVTRDVLAEIGASDVPSRLLLNKVDRLSAEQKADLQKRYPEAVLLSAHTNGDVAALRQTIIDFFEDAMVDADVTIPYAQQAKIAEIYASARVVSESFDEEGRHLKIRALPAAIAKLTA
jgi:GTP-binding protein HflX